MITLFQHQKFVLEQSKNLKSYAWFMETGTGKTIVAIENIKHLWEQKEINFAFILAPKTVIDCVWVPELARYDRTMPHRLFKWVGNIRDSDKIIIYNILERMIDNKHSTILPILIINSEAFSHIKIYNFILDLVKVTNNIMVIDESTCIKNIKAKITKGILKISDYCNYKRIMSGFPVLRSPEDLYSQVIFLGRNLIPYRSYYAFRNEYSNLRQMGKYFISTSHKNLSHLSKLIEPFSTRITKKECLDLPDKIRTKRYIDMTPEQKELYESMKKFGYAELKKTDQKVFASSLIVQVGKLHQIANGILIQNNQHIPTYKYDIICKTIEDEVSGQIVIWFCFTMNLLKAKQIIQKKFGWNSCREVYGDIPQQNRVANIQAFQNKQYPILLANPSTIMHGLNLVNCSYSGYANNSTHLEHRIQSEDRFHRIGQINKVTYIDFITFGTMEEKLLDRLQEHHKVGSEILQDSWEEWFQ